MGKKIGIIGASGAGLYASLFVSNADKNAQITLIDHKKSVGKKLTVTGNGHCNLLPGELNPSYYRDSDWFKQVLGELTISDLKQVLEDYGISLTKVNNLYYPESYHAPSFVSFLEEKLLQNRVRFQLETHVLDYQMKNGQYEVHTDKGNFYFDKLVFASGGASTPNLGSDGSLFEIFQKHGYKVNKLLPGLAPIKTKESTKRLAGIRHEVCLKLMINKSLAYEEKGEVLFKKDGISGICVMNAESIWARKGCPEGKIILDLYPNESLEHLQERLMRLESISGEHYLDAILINEFKEYVLYGTNRFYGDVRPNHVAEVLKHFIFHPAQPYGFEDSQVTIGGVAKEEVNEYFASKKEQGVYFIGECLDNDGLCGGNNLAWCLLNAMKVKEGI